MPFKGKKSKKEKDTEDSYELDIDEEIERELPDQCDLLLERMIPADDDLDSYNESALATEKADKLGCLEPIKEHLKNQGIEDPYEVLGIIGATSKKK